MDKLLFLLGGHDLEMITIKEILINYNFVEVDKSNYKEQPKAFIDKNLTWENANLKEYQEYLDYPGTIICVELTMNGIEISNKNIIQIDHHDEYSHKKSSLEQVAELLDIELNHYQNLVAANDRGYIPEMFRCCSTYTEMLEIRQKDRIAQGVTNKDEEEAEKAIHKKTTKNGIIIVKSVSNRFSPITDRLFPYEKLLIYNNNKLVYYGKDAKKVAEKNVNLIKKGKAYYGGINNGFFGIKEGKMKPEELDKLKNNIIEQFEEPEMYPKSHHIFLFPFRWDYIPNEVINDDVHSIDFHERIKFNKIIQAVNESDKWTRNKLGFNDQEEFNTSGYFYPFVNDAVFDEEKAFNNKPDEERVVISYQIKLSTKKRSEYKIHIKKKTDGPYVLYVDKILLNIYETGIAILSYHLTNYSSTNHQDIININDYGRRIYPQFLGENLISETKNNFLADKIEMNLYLENQDSISTNETFCHYSDLKNIKKVPFQLPDHITKLLGEKFKTRISDKQKDLFLVRWLIDDRMFVICWHGNDAVAEELCSHKFIKSNRTYEYNYQNNPLWHQYIFVDNGFSTCQNKNMNLKLLNDHTYERWTDTDYNTLFGISRYSFIIVSKNNEYTREYLHLKHIKTIYFQIIRLCLAQRASIIRFSDEVTSISNLKINDGKQLSKLEINQEQLSKIKQLNHAYLQFVNQMYFREITAQEQGIDLYDMIQLVMRIERDIKDLDRELDELHQFSRLLHDEMERKDDIRRNKFMERLTIFGTMFLIPTFIASIFGMNTYTGKYISILKGDFDRNFIFSLILLVLISIPLFFWARWYFKRKINR